MLRGLYAANTNLSYCSNRLDAVSNNIANSGTYGFKKDTVFGETFNDKLILKLNGSDNPGQPAFRGITSKRHDDGQVELLTNSGYFRVMTPNGVSNNRNIKFGITEDGYLSTIDYTSDKQIDRNHGNKVLDSSGNTINVGVGTNLATIAVDKNGKLTVAGAEKANLLYMPALNGIGTWDAGVFTKRSVTDYTQGELQQTGGKTDFSMTDVGFFVVKTPIGDVYTRNGAFKLDKDLYLTTTEGFRVQGIKGDIRLESGEFAVNRFGEIISNGETVDKLKTTNFENKGDLEKVGSTYFAVRIPDKTKPVSPTFARQIEFKGDVIQGMIEKSNVNAATEMVKMITLHREFESGQKLIQAYDNTLSKAVNEIGKV